jgi:two-component system response regulator RegA
MTEQFPTRILIVDDHQSICRLCASIAKGMGLVCWQAETAEAALAQVRRDPPELILADLTMSKMSGLELLAEVKKYSPQTEVALMSAYGTMESAVQAIRMGAYDFVVKPFRVEKLKLLLQRMVEKVRLVRENDFLRSQMLGKPDSNDLEQLERLTVERVFQQVGGDKELAQKQLGISRATLYRKIKLYGIQTCQKQRQASDRQLRGVDQMVILSQR